jgi:hypothetical protein
MEALSFAADAANVSVTASSAEYAIPNSSDGLKTRYLYLASDNDVYFKLGLTGDPAVTAVNGTLLKSAGPMVVQVSGATHVIAIGPVGGEALCIAPLEW